MKSLEIAHNFGKNKNVSEDNCAIDKKLLKITFRMLLASMSKLEITEK